MAILIAVLCLCFVGCDRILDILESYVPQDSQSSSDDDLSVSESESASESQSESQAESESESQAESESESQGESNVTGDKYFVATIVQNKNIEAYPYIDDAIIDDALKGVFYSTDEPGGEPIGDGSGKIWLVLKPVRKFSISKIDIEGTYSSIENLGRDIYCIHGVESNLSVSVGIRSTPVSEERVFADFGYGISDDGTMTVTWSESLADPLRYVELIYSDGKSTRSQYVDANDGSFELVKMTENLSYTVSAQAIGYNQVGAKIEFESCYMTAPKGVAFPRVEITTENYIWPSCELVSSPSGAWGAGITNAFYEQCVMNIYNAENELVFNSGSSMGEGNEFYGAKMRIRGNTSAHHEKNNRYPFKIKLSSRADLLEPLIGRTDNKVYEDKDWVLLNYGADAFRVCGDAIADAVGTEWSPDYRYVSLYVNGDYRGLYVLSESVKVGNGEGDEQSRVAVDDSGYLFECDAYWWNEDLYFNTPITEKSAMYYTFKYPDSEDINEGSPEYVYIKDYVTRFEEALLKDDDSYLDYIDLDSFVKWLLVADYLCISDGGGCNIYICKKDSTDGTKLTMGPNWDFDSYKGSVDAFATIRVFWNEAPFYYGRLVKKESFQKRYKELFEETREELSGYVDNAFSLIDSEAHAQLLQYDNTRFGTSTKTLLTRKAEFLSWLEDHIEWMESQLK